MGIERSEALDTLGEPLKTSDSKESGWGFVFRTDYYENGDIYEYLLRDGKYELYFAYQASGMWEGLRSLAIGDSVHDVLSAFYCQFDDWILGDGFGGNRFAILYGLYPANHYIEGGPVAPSGTIFETRGYYFQGEFHKDESAYQIRYEYCSPDDSGYQKVLLGEIDYSAIIIQNDEIIAIYWG